MQEECIVCKAPLIYLEQDEWMECELCHKKELSKTRCQNGHYVCNDCHTKGLDTILSLCIDETSRNPIEIVRKMMDASFCHMHGPEHHVMVGAALLTAYKNAGGAINLRESVMEMLNRGKAVPGGTCGFWGACGAGISAGMFVSILSGATPLTEESWGLSNQMTSKALEAISRTGGPRCCKRDSYLAILAARQPFSLEGQTLHAGVLGFIHPRTGEYVEFSAPLPAYFEELLEKLRKKAGK